MFNQKPFYFFSLISAFLIATFMIMPVGVQAASLQELQRQQEKAAADAEKYRDLQESKQKEATTYEGQVKLTEENIHVVEHAVEATTNQISTKEKNLTETVKGISETSGKLSDLKEKQNEGIVTLYMLSNTSEIEMLASSAAISEFADNVEYLDSVQEHLLSVIGDTTATKTDLETKKTALENQRAELAQLQGQQRAQKGGLEQEKQLKNTLLTQASNQAETYDKLADEAEARRQEFDRQVAAAIRAAKARPGSVVRKGPVKKGDVIGYMGNSGYSTGAHLHFSTIQSGGDYVNPRTVIGKNGNTWPFNSYYVTQEFGKSTWASKYAWHNGMDMVDKNGYGAPVRAMADGEIIEPFSNYNGWMPSGYGRYVVIDHGNGLWSLYAHMIN